MTEEKFPVPMWGWQRNPWAYVVLLMVVWLFLWWDDAAAQWERRGCERPHLVAVMYGEPEWFERCSDRDRD